MTEETAVKAEEKKETPSEIHAKLLCVMTEVFFFATAGLHYQVEANKYFSVISLILRAAGYLSQRNIFCRNEFLNDKDLEFGRNLIKKFNDIYDSWRDDTYSVPFYSAIRHQDISENKEWEKIISHVEKFSHSKNSFETPDYPYSIYEEE